MPVEFLTDSHRRVRPLHRRTVSRRSCIDDDDYRRRILRQLNRGEGRHAVARAVFFVKKGELLKKYRSGQEDQLEALGLVVNLIALWKTTHIDRALTRLRRDGHAVALLPLL